MLKVALCLSGQPRSFELGHTYHAKNILDRKDIEVDTFCHFWSRDNEHEEMVSDALEKLYRPKMISFDAMDDKTYIEACEEMDRDFTRIQDSRWPARNTLSMWYSVYRSYELFREYRNKQYENLGWEEKIRPIEYDVVVRSRYDYALSIQPDFQKVEVGKVYVPADRMTVNNDFCADMFAYGTPAVMEKYSTTVTNTKAFYDSGVVMNAEEMLAAQLKVCDLTGQNMVYVEMNNPFPPGPYNGNRHSIIRDDFTEWNTLRG